MDESSLQSPLDGNRPRMRRHGCRPPRSWNFCPASEGRRRRCCCRCRPFEAYAMGGSEGSSFLVPRISSNCVNYFGMLYTVTLVTASVVVTIAVSIPSLPASYPAAVPRLLKLWTWFVFANLSANYVLLLVSARKSYFRAAAPDDPSAGHHWKHCRACDHFAPPRSRHCGMCHRCILKQDHHCIFTGCCIGFYNQRYFIVFCVYGWMGSFESAALILLHLNSKYAPLYGSSAFNYLPPNAFLNWILGDIEFGVLCILVLLYLLLSTHLACTYFMFWQFLLLVRGQTAYEYVKGINTFKTTFRRHVRSIFGPYWLFNFIIPLPWLQNVDSGVTWNTFSWTRKV